MYYVHRCTSRIPQGQTFKTFQIVPEAKKSCSVLVERGVVQRMLFLSSNQLAIRQGPAGHQIPRWPWSYRLIEDQKLAACHCGTLYTSHPFNILVTWSKLPGNHQNSCCFRGRRRPSSFRSPLFAAARDPALVAPDSPILRGLVPGQSHSMYVYIYIICIHYILYNGWKSRLLSFFPQSRLYLSRAYLSDLHILKRL